MTNYITGITWYDDTKEGFATDIGTTKIDGSPNKLAFSAWGDTKEKSKEMAEMLVTLLNNTLAFKH